MDCPDPSDLLPVGIIGKPHGVKGEMRLHLFEGSSQAVQSVDTVYLQSSHRLNRLEEKPIQKVRTQGKELIIVLGGVESRTDAEAFKGCTVLLRKSSFPELEEDEFYDVDLIGLGVCEDQGSIVGEVIDVEHPPSTDVLVIKVTTGEFVDVPLAEPFVKAIDVKGRRITIELPDELPRRSRK